VLGSLQVALVDGVGARIDGRGRVSSGRDRGARLRFFCYAFA